MFSLGCAWWLLGRVNRIYRILSTAVTGIFPRGCIFLARSNALFSQLPLAVVNIATNPSDPGSLSRSTIALSKSPERRLHCSQRTPTVQIALFIWLTKPSTRLWAYFKIPMICLSVASVSCSPFLSLSAKAYSTPPETSAPIRPSNEQSSARHKSWRNTGCFDHDKMNRRESSRFLQPPPPAMTPM